MKKELNFDGYNGDLKEKARELRKSMTEYERKLWHLFLKNYELKFYRQRAIHNYIADFYCHVAKLVIELDGSQHYEHEACAYDNYRTEILNSYGLTVMRFSNAEIRNNFSDVCEIINQYCRSATKKV